eukprot:SAG31_NODE_5514_length_2485_cov_1.728835_3_plen_99_part_00
MPPNKSRNGGSDALWTIGISLTVFAILYACVVTEVPLEGEELEAADKAATIDTEDLYENLLETEDVRPRRTIAAFHLHREPARAYSRLLTLGFGSSSN